MKTIRLTRYTAGLLVILAALMMGTLLFATPASAIAIVPECARNQSAKAPGLDCGLETFENIARLILGITGSLALLMFVYGGFTLLTSGGGQEKVTKGKTIIRNSVIGIFIIFLSGYIVRYSIASIRGSRIPQKAGKVCGEESVKKGKKAMREYQIDGKAVCAKSCSQVPNYSCTTKTKGKDCLIGLCPGNAKNLCCK